MLAGHLTAFTELSGRSLPYQRGVLRLFSRIVMRFFTIFRRKKAPHFRAGLLHLYNAWQFPTLAWGDPTLPSALRRFTSEFGMGSGGTTALKPPGKSCCTKRIFYVMTAWSRRRIFRFRKLLSGIKLKIVSLKNASGVVRLSLTGH
jgi:hypothetical protein